MTNGKQKGKEGEREVVNLLKEHGFEARRGQQFKGTPDSPDVVHSMHGFHIEVKRVEAFYLYKALEQAEQDAGDEDIPVVFHRKNKERWVVVIDAEDFLTLMKDFVYDG